MVGIRLNQRSPDVTFKKKKTGGVPCLDRPSHKVGTRAGCIGGANFAPVQNRKGGYFEDQGGHFG